MRELCGVGECNFNSIIVAEIIKRLMKLNNVPSPRRFHEGNVDEAIKSTLEKASSPKCNYIIASFDLESNESQGSSSRRRRTEKLLRTYFDFERSKSLLLNFDKNKCVIVYQTKKMKKRVILILFDPNPEDCLLKGEDVKERRRVKSARHFNKSPKKIRELIEEHVNEIVSVLSKEFTRE